MEWNTLPGFRTYNEFFEEAYAISFKKSDTASGLSGALINSISRIPAIKTSSGLTSEVYSHAQFAGLISDWQFTAAIGGLWLREVFNPSVPAFLCRFEVTSMLPNAVLFPRPTNLYMLINRHFEPLTYTIMVRDGSIRPHFPACSNRTHGCGFEFALQELKDGAELLRLANPTDDGENIKIELLTREPHPIYRLQWQSHDFPFFFAYDSATMEEAKDLILYFAAGGLPAVQGLYKWRNMSLDEALKEDDSILSPVRDLERAERDRVFSG